MCQEIGCVKTEPEHLDILFSMEQVDEFIEDFEKNLLNGVLEGIDWIKLPEIPRIQNSTDVDSHGIYHNLTEMVLAICELSGLKPYEIVHEDGQFAGYTFEVVE
jgi:hypothetical protein